LEKNLLQLRLILLIHLQVFLQKKRYSIRSASELEQITHILTNLKLTELAKRMDKVNPSDLKDKAKSNAGDSDIIEI
jgi:hypothetical protein